MTNKTEAEMAALFHRMLHGALVCGPEGACPELAKASDLAAAHVGRAA